MNLRRQARNALVVNSETSSIWTALTDIDTNTHICAFEMVGLRMGPLLDLHRTSIIPMVANTVPGWAGTILSTGSFPIFCNCGLADSRRHTIQPRVIDQMHLWMAIM